MIYLDIIMTDKPDANEITPKVDHRAFLLKDVLKKPKFSLWDLYKLKKHLETGYEKLSEEQKIEEPTTQSTEGEPTIEGEVQADPDNTWTRVEIGSRDDSRGVE